MVFPGTVTLDLAATRFSDGKEEYDMQRAEMEVKHKDNERLEWRRLSSNKSV